MKKGIIIFSVMCMCMYSPVTVFAESISSEVITQETAQISLRAEQVKWYYRNHDGVKQKRLWSVTYGYWKTKWINC